MSNEVEFNSLAGKDEVKVKLEQPSRIPQKPSDEEVAKYSKTRMCLVVFFGLIIIAMIVAAVIIIIVAPKCAKAKVVEEKDQSWLKHDVVYQISPQSFKDSDKDGKGDLKGIVEKLDYLEGLGVKILRLSSVYSDEDLQKVHADLGEMKDFEELAKKAHEKEMKIILDFAPNYVSAKNKWFMESSENKTNGRRNWFVWRDAANNWPSKSGGSAWENSAKTNQLYLHQFAVDQPDLNYNESAVVKAMSEVLKFWSTKGADGFSASDVEYLVEDKQFRNDGQTAKFNASLPLQYDMTTHDRTFGLPGNLDIVQKFRSALDSTDGPYRALLVQLSSTAQLAQFYNNSDIPSFTGLANVDKANMAPSVNMTVMGYLASLPKGKWPTFGLGGASFGDALVDAMNVLLLTLPGTPMTSSGQELGSKFEWAGVEKQANDSKSHYSVFKDVSKLRQEEAFKSLATKDIHADSQVFAYLRGNKYLVLINFSTTEWDEKLPKISAQGVVKFDSKFELKGNSVDVQLLKLKPGQAVVIELKRHELQ